MTIDQDGMSIKPIVWFGRGEIVCNDVLATIRDFDGAFQWMVRVQDNLGYATAQTGVAMDLEDAQAAAATAIEDILEVERGEP